MLKNNAGRTNAGNDEEQSGAEQGKFPANVNRATAGRFESSPSEYLTTVEAAAHLRASKSYLDKFRVYGGGPPFLRFGKRKILYRKSDLEAWARQRQYGSTSEYETVPAESETE